MASDLSAKRRVIKALERFGGRGLLARAGTTAARKTTGADVALFFDDIWVRRIGDICFGDKQTFDYYADEFRSWNAQHDIWLNDPPDFWFHAYRPQPGDTVVDVGAGFGNDAVAFARAVGETGRVLAIEAHPDAARKLEKTVQWSKLSNVTPLAIAVGDETGTVHITGDYDDVANSILETVAEGPGGFDVPLRRLDDVLKTEGVTEVSVLKMNIEGAETAALKGMPEYLGKTRSAVIACHDFRADAGESEYFRTRDDVTEMLQAAGFTLSLRPDDPRPYVRDMIYATRP